MRNREILWKWPWTWPAAFFVFCFFFFSPLKWLGFNKKEGKVPTFHGNSAYRDPFCHRPLAFIITQLNAVVHSLQWPCVDLSSANAAEAKGSYKGLSICFPLRDIFWSILKNLRWWYVLLLSSSNGWCLFVEIKIWVLGDLFVQKWKTVILGVGVTAQRSNEKLYSHAHTHTQKCACPDSTVLF